MYIYKITNIINEKVYIGRIYSSLRDAKVATSKNGKYNENLCRCLKNKTECRYNGVNFKIIE